MMSTADFTTRCEIRDALARYVRGVDRLDAALIRSCYHPDAYEVHGIFNGNAYEFADWRVRQTFRSHHVLSESAIRINDERAFVETPFAAVTHVDIATPDHAGIIESRSDGWYLDLFTREEGRWAIKHRHVNVFARSQVLIEAGGQPQLGGECSALGTRVRPAQRSTGRFSCGGRRRDDPRAVPRQAPRRTGLSPVVVPTDRDARTALPT
ncbi:nuclear transport factor 2 family protein [Nocardioides sp. JQ2195]|uniref:nuclear transport factor 2 family protein n=1 Tax=Nocardioides sp. JQ2195 TaxID=2592334 RepID=UPI00143E14CE|nr:nuclear transport factor 2 family protein [Nocardioides sp. JQ2195]QIX26518.1 nuclear transport factor 2 family protein [Nocardioides sp. JQ2195]